MTEIPVNDIPTYTVKDFKSDQTVRWCPGCGDYAILSSTQKAMTKLGRRKEDIVFISGIGCSSRFPYYMDTYGIHSIHGRAPTLASGLKIANPDLTVFVITGDGDGLSIGGNHVLHACRRNIDINIMLFNNRIYGLTKGQYSPTTPEGHKTKTSPMGSIDHPVNPLAFALAAGATFVARGLDRDTRGLDGLLVEAAAHKGVSFLEILQNCIIFYDGAWDFVAERDRRDDNALFLKHGEPMVFGKDHDRGIRLNGFNLEVIYFKDGYSEADCLVHDETNFTLAQMLAQMEHPQFPVPMGVLYRVQRPPYEERLMEQIEQAKANAPHKDLNDLYFADYTWEVTESATAPVRVSDDETMSALDEEYVDALDRSLEGAAEEDEIHDSLKTDPLKHLLEHGRALVTVPPTATLAETVQRMQDENIGAILVVDDSARPIGILTETDILRKVATRVQDLSAQVVADYMTRNPDTLPSDAPIAHALRLMSLHHYRHIPVVDDKGVAIGMISFRSVVNYIEKWFDSE